MKVMEELRLGFFGGASGIGASCVLVQSGHTRIVVDCGIRQARGESLPDLRGLQDSLGNEPPDAVVLTHAHLDHSGALPVLLRQWPDLRVITTRPTADLVRILLHDAVRVMDTGREEELPLYGTAEVDRTLAALRPVDLDDPVPVSGGATIRLLQAGHILGASAVAIEANRRLVLLSGDISFTQQRSVPGMPVPRLRPDVLVVESTYGDRLHSSREAEERRLCEQIGRAIQDGGHVLVPAFAVGRAQEVLLTLRDAMKRGRLGRFPVHADGMVRAVCSAYRAHPVHLQQRLRRDLGKGRDPFFDDELEFAQVRSRAHRDEIIGGPPCCVVASSGMLAGGASPVYARAWAGEEASLIAITGYQDEESPGRALLRLADGKARQLRLPEGPVDVRCRIERYHLSAHADADEIVGLAHRLDPGSLYVVHGDAAAREALGARLDAALRGRVVLPRDGEVMAEARRPRRRAAEWIGPGLGRGKPLDVAGLSEIRDLWRTDDATGRGRARTAEEIARAWFGESAGPTEAAEVRTLLADDRTVFEPDRALAFRYRPVAQAPIRKGPAPVAEVFEIVDELLPDTVSGLYRRSAHQEERRLVLSFEFPDVQGPRAADAIAAIADRTGWHIEVHPRPHQGRLGEVLRELLPAGTAVSAGPSLMLDHRQVRVGLTPLPANCREIADRYHRLTGWELVLVESEQPSVAARTTAGGTTAELSPQESKAAATALFADLAEYQRPSKMSFPPGGLVLHLVHPGQQNLHRERMVTLADRTGRDVRVHPHPIQQRLVELVRERLPEEWVLTRPPAYVPQLDAVRIRVWSLPSGDQLDEVQRVVERDTGCSIEVVEGG
jgi:uncharacterized protein